MSKNNHNKLEEEILKKAKRREKKKKRMPVSGKGVFKLQKLMTKRKTKD